MNSFLPYYFITINLVTFVFIALDKIFAIKKMRRINEFILLFISFLGGSIGEMLGMLLFHHKTKHLKFILLNPFFLLLLILLLFTIKLLTFS